MKSLGPLLSALCAAALLTQCEKPAPSAAEPQPETPLLPRLFPAKPTPLPVERRLTDNGGRALDATIVARTESSLFVVRQSDGLQAEIPLATLSPDDQSFAAGLELKEPPPDFRKAAADPAKAPKPPYVASREAEIERLTRENQRLLSEAESSTNEMLVRNRRSTIQKNEEEIAKLRSAIERYQLDQRDR